MLTLTGTYDKHDGSIVPMKFVLKDDKYSFWTYDYYGNRVTVTRKLAHKLDWDFYRRVDTSGEEYHFWKAYTGETGYYNYKLDCTNINLQTWDFETVWVQVMYPVKGDKLECETMRITLDDKSKVSFQKFIKELQ